MKQSSATAKFNQKNIGYLISVFHIFSLEIQGDVIVQLRCDRTMKNENSGSVHFERMVLYSTLSQHETDVKSYLLAGTR